tara:strand:+ start:328 stop:579 length:252 start_codon:yes stop_codon:yes gene_type:complete
MSDLVLVVELPGIQGGLGGILLDSIYAILPDTSASTTRSVIYTSIFTEGLAVMGEPAGMVGLWMEGLDVLMGADEAEGADDVE